MLSDPHFYLAAVPAMIILGLSKGGFSTVGVLSVPIMSLVISPVQAAGIQLPILIATDIVAVASYRGLYDRRVLMLMIPFALVGVAIGWATAAWVTDDLVRLIVGVISVAFALYYWIGGLALAAPASLSPFKAGVWGTISGFTSFVSHSGAPPFQMFTLPLKLPHRIFAGTSVLFFAVVNTVKLVPYFMLGQLRVENLTVAAALAPIAVVSTLVAVWLIKRINTALFYRIVYALIFLLGLKLVWDGASSLA